MATIPIYARRASLTTQGPAIKKDSEFEAQQSSGMEKAGKLLSGTGDLLKEVDNKIRAVSNANAGSEMDIYTTQEMANYTDEINKKTDLDTALNDVPGKINSWRNEVSKRFKDPAARDEYLRKFDLKAIGYQVQLKADNANKQVDKGRVNYLTKLDLESSNYINAATSEEKIQSRKDMEAIMNQASDLGLFTREQAYDEVNKAIKDADEAVASREKLRARKEKELAWAEERAKSELEKSYMTMKKTGTDKLGGLITNQDMITMAVKDTSLSPQFKTAYINALTSPKAVNAKTKSVSFSNLMSDINKGIVSPDKIRSNILKDNSDGYLSNDDSNILNDYLDMLSSKNPDDLVAMDIRKSWLGVEVYSENTSKKEDSRRRMSLSFINKINSGAEPQVAATEAMREEVVYLHPEIINYPDGMEYMDDSGRIKKIMPNGDVVDIQSTKKDTRKKEQK